MSTKSKRYHFTADQKLEMSNMYSDGLAWSDISEKFGCSRRTIEYHLKCAGVKMRPRGISTKFQRGKMSGPNNPMWKGGITKDRYGYVSEMVYDHPVYGTRPVRQHRKVMESHLLDNEPDHPALFGEVLRSDWVVHHKNGIKSDNRIENLDPMPRNKHHSWIHFKEEMAQLKSRVTELEKELASCRVPHFAV